MHILYNLYSLFSLVMLSYFHTNVFEVKKMSNMTNCIVAQSGGPTVAINASLAGVIDGVKKSKTYNKIYGSIHGIQGVLRRQYIDLSDSSEDFITSLCATPAMYLGSCRYKLPPFKESPESYEDIFEVFKELSIGAFFYIGGNDSMDTAAKLAEYAKEIGSDIKIVGIPKTIDNDLIMTDHTPGFGSAAKYVATSIREIAYDTYIYDVLSVNIVEIMGRDAGWLTAASALARTKSVPAPHLIYLPEVAFDKEQFIEDLKKLLPIHRNIVVAVSEGIKDKDGNYLSATDAAADKFGHAQLSGTGKALEYLVKEKLGIKVRSVEINVLQRCASHLASKTDIEESFELGSHGVYFAENGKTGIMVAVNRLISSPYKYEIVDVPVCDVANQAKAVPLDFINKDGNDVTQEMIEYLRPLVQGEVSIHYDNGLPEYLNLSHLTHME